MRVLRILGTVAVLFVALLFGSSSLLAEQAQSGYDLFETYPDGTFADLSGPAALLNIPFSGPPEKVRVYFTGVPIKLFRDKDGKEQKNLGTTDTVVERTPGDVPSEVGKEVTVQLRLVALSLHGIFTDDRGQNWEVRITPSEKQPSTGTMTIRRESAEGGTFNATLTVVARMEFTSGSDKRVLDPAPPITFETVPSDSHADAIGVQGGVAWQLLPPAARIARADLARNFHPKKPFDEKEFTALHRVWVAQLKELLRQGIIPLPPNSKPKQCKAGGGGNPVGRIAADGSQASPFLLVANEGSGTLATVDLQTRQVKTVAVGSAPHSVDLTPDGRRAFVGNFGSGDISVVDIPNQRVLETIRVGNQTTALVFDPNTNKIYATNFGDNNVTIVQYREGGSQVVGTVRNVRQPLDIELSPDGRRGYVSSQRAGEGVTVFDTASASLVTRIPIPNAELRKIAVSPDGRRLYAAVRTDPFAGTGQIAVIDTASLQLIGQIPVEAFSFGLTVTPSGKCLVVTHTVPNRVSFIDVRTKEVLAVLGDPADIEPQEIAILENLAYVTNRQSDSISIFDLGPCQ